MRFSVLAEDPASRARKGLLALPHALVETPCFMPVGTQATVKGASVGDLTELGYGLLLANTYHLHLRPGEDLIARMGGIGRFAGWPGALLTDSGGYQVYSLAKLRRVEKDGIRFQSHLDGSERFFTPEAVMAIQRDLGADIVMAFDECAPYPCDAGYAREAMERTHRWAERCATAHAAVSGRAKGGWSQALFGIAQGAVYRGLREESARFVTSLDLPGYAIGGLAVGEDRETRNACVEWCTAILPPNKPRYLMGVGTPLDIVDAVGLGVDMFDCVLPTRNGRTGQAFTSEGIVNIRNARYAEADGPLDAACGCCVCAGYRRAYLRHLFITHEMLGPILLTHHNLAYYARLMASIRRAIADGAFTELADDLRARLGHEDERP